MNARAELAENRGAGVLGAKSEARRAAKEKPSERRRSGGCSEAKDEKAR